MSGPGVSGLDVLVWILAAVGAGSIAYTGISLHGALRFFRCFPRRFLPATPPSIPGNFSPPLSLLKPLYGADRELEANLESFCRQDYPHYEILFSVRDQSDPAVAIVDRLQQNHPTIPIRLLVLGPPKYPNAKVHGLEAMMEAAAHQILVVSDSDMRVSPQYLSSVVAPLADEKVGMSTVISRGVAGRSIWSLLETLGMNTQFTPGILSAWVLLGLEFALGPTMVVRKTVIEQMGGFGTLGDYLADDFVLGERVARLGHRVELAMNIPDHLIWNDSFRQSLDHRLRWERSSRRSRPAGYLGQVFTHALPLAAGLGIAAGAIQPAGAWLAWTLAGLCLVARAVQAWFVGWTVLRDGSLKKFWWLLPVQDLVSFLIWLAAFFGKQVEWRGERFEVLRGGKLKQVSR